MNVTLNSIIHQFQGKSENSTLSLEKQQDGYNVSVEEKFSTLTLTPSWDCIREILGKNRLEAIAKHPDLGLDESKICQNRLGLTRSVVRNLFIGMMDVGVEQLRAAAKSSSVDQAYRQMIVFENMQEVQSAMMDAKPESIFIDYVKTSGLGFKGLVERVHVAMQHHFDVIKETNKEAGVLRDIEMLTSRFADRQIPEGSVVHLTEGYYYLEKIIMGGGAFIYLLADVEEKKIPKLLCRGTAMRASASGGLKSGINDVQLEIGSLGVREVWPELSSYLKQKKVTSLDILGKSLGGAHAQNLAVLIEGIQGIKVNKLVTFACVGAGSQINDLFKKEILPRRTSPFEIQVVRNGGSEPVQVDYIPAVGGVHLGHGAPKDKCKVEVVYIQPRSSRPWTNPQDMSIYTMIKSVIISLGSAHRRQTTLQDFTWKKLEEPAEVDRQLNLGNRLETVRKIIAYAMHIFTFCQLNRPSLTSFFYTQKTKNQ